jgi:hypothetical protein
LKNALFVGQNFILSKQNEILLYTVFPQKVRVPSIRQHIANNLGKLYTGREMLIAGKQA